jgi:hypothetical protein
LLPTLGSLVALAAAGCALAGCAGGSPAAASNPNSSAPTRAQALVYANAVNLQATDLNGVIVASPGHEGKAPTPGDVELDRCVGAANPDTRVLKVVSPAFQGTTSGAFEQFSSTVEVEPTAAVVARNLAAIRSSRGLACLKRILPRDFGHSPHGSVTVTRLPEMPAVPGSFAIQVTTTISRNATRPIPFAIELSGFAAGHAEVGLLTVSAPQPIPTEATEHLLAVLYGRAQAHSL